MQLSLELNLYLISCPDKLIPVIKDAANSVPRPDENYEVVVSIAGRPDKNMKGHAIILYGSRHIDFVGKNVEDTDFLLLDNDFDLSLIKSGVSDIISEPGPDDRLRAAVINLIKRCYFRRRFELRDYMLNCYYKMSDNMLWTKDMKDLHMDVNHFITDLVEKNPEEIEGKHEIEIYNLDPNDPGCGESDRYVRTNGLSSSFFESVPDKNGKKRHLAVVKSPWFDRQGRIVGTIGIGKDITELMNQKTRFNTFINSLDYIIIITDCNNKILQINRAFADTTEDAPVNGKPIDVVLSEYFRPSEEYGKNEYIRIGENGTSKLYWHLSKFSLRDFWGEYTGNIYILEDITKQREQSQQIFRMMRTDPLTGVNNKAGMYDNFRNSEKKGKSSFFFICIDNFKYIGNTYGHEVADHFLQDVSRLITEVLPDADITRYSENEFFVILPGSLYEGQVRKFARNLIDRTSYISGYSDAIIQKCQMFIGVLYDEEMSEYIDTIVKKAETAMLHAKKNNTSRYFVAYGSS